MGTTPPVTRTTPVTPALLHAQGRQRDGMRQSDPPPYCPPRPHKRGARRTGRPPPKPAPRRTNATDPPHGGRTAPSQVGGNRDRTAPPPSMPDGARDLGRRRGGARTTWNGPTSAQCWDRARCARHTTQGGGERTPRERERTHTQRARRDYQKGNWTELAEHTDRVEWRTSEQG